MRSVTNNRAYSNQSGGPRSESNILGLGQSADRDRPHHLAVPPNRHSATPSNEPVVSKIGDLKTLLRVPRLLPDLFRTLPLPRRRVSLVQGDTDRRYRSTVHARECDQL